MSAIVTRDGTVYTSTFVDSHSDLALVFGLRDDDALNPRYARVELSPQSANDWLHPERWGWSVDEPVPEWFDESEQRRARAAMTARLNIRTEGVVPLIADGWWVIGGTCVVNRVVAGRIHYVGDSAQIRGVYDSAQIHGVYDSAQIHGVYDSDVTLDASARAHVVGSPQAVREWLGEPR